MKVRRLLNFFLGIPLTILSFLFIGKIFLDNSDLISKSILQLDPAFFVAGIFFFALFFALKSFIWLKILSTRGYQPTRLSTLHSYSISEVKRYIPGSIFAVIGRVGTHAHEIPKKETLKGIGIEALLLSSSALFVSIPAIYFVIKMTGGNPEIATIAIIGFIALFLAGIIYKIKIRKVIFAYIDYFFFFSLAWIFYGLGCLFTIISLTFVDSGSILTIISLFVASWLAGYLFFIAPMGLGIRELTTTFALSFFVPVPIASIVAILSRIAMILGEMLYLLILFTLKKFHLRLIKKIKVDILIVPIVALTYFVYFSIFTVLRHNSFMSGRFDLGNMTQTVWNTAQGRFFMLTNPDGVENVSRLAVHSDFILIFFAPFYYLWSHPGVLLIGQSFILSLGGIFVYLLSLELLKKKNLALVITLSYYFNFWLHEQNIFDFHAVALSTTFLLAAFYFMLKKSYLFLAIALSLAVITKENIFLVASFFGLYFIFKEKKYIVGSLLTVLSLAAFYFLSSVATPLARGEAHFALEAYSYLGNSIPEIIINTLTKPQILISQLFNFSTLYYFHTHLVTTGYLALLSPIYLLFAFPEFAIYLLSGNFEYRSYEYHFGAAIIPFIYISTIYGIRYLLSKVSFISSRIIIYYLLTVSLLTAYFYSPLIGMKNSIDAKLDTAKAVKINKYLKQIPPFATVSATNEVGAHLSHREHIYVLPHGAEIAEYIAIYKNESMKELVDNSKYDDFIKDNDLNFYIFKKKSGLHCSTCNP